MRASWLSRPPLAGQHHRAPVVADPRGVREVAPVGGQRPVDRGAQRLGALVPVDLRRVGEPDVAGTRRTVEQRDRAGAVLDAEAIIASVPLHLHWDRRRLGAGGRGVPHADRGQRGAGRIREQASQWWRQCTGQPPRCEHHPQPPWPDHEVVADLLASLGGAPIAGTQIACGPGKGARLHRQQSQFGSAPPAAGAAACGQPPACTS